MSYIITEKSGVEKPSESYEYLEINGFSVFYVEENVELIEEDRLYLFHGFTSENSSKKEVEQFKEYYEKGKPNSLKGNYAGIVVKKGILEVYRDSFGSKPVYFTENSVTVSSFIKNILKTLSVSAKQEKEVVADYLGSGLVDHRRKTFFKDIKRLKPRENLIYTNKVAISNTDQLETTEKTIESSLKDRIDDLKPHNEKYYCPISGGLDSSITASRCGDAHHINLSFKQGTVDDQYIDHVKSFYDLESETIEVKPLDILDEVEKTILTQEEPSAFPAVSAQSILYRNIEDGSTVISGTGADELFLGYTWFLPLYLSEKIKNEGVMDFLNELVKYRRTISTEHLKGIKEILLKDGIELCLDAEDLLTVDSSTIKYRELESARRKHLTDFYFPHLIRSIAKLSAENNVTVKPAFVSQDLLNTSLSIEPEKNFQEGLTKYQLRSAFKDELPEKVFNRKKKTGILSADNKLYTKPCIEKFVRIFSSESFQDRELVKSEKVLKQLETGILPFEIAYRFYNYELWMRKFIDKN